MFACHDLRAGRRPCSGVDRGVQPAIAAVRDLDGFVDAFFLVERDGRHALTITLWENVDTMGAGASSHPARGPMLPVRRAPTS